MHLKVGILLYTIFCDLLSTFSIVVLLCFLIFRMIFQVKRDNANYGIISFYSINVSRETFIVYQPSYSLLQKQQPVFDL